MSFRRSAAAAMALVTLAATAPIAMAAEENCTSAPSASWRTPADATAAAEVLGYKVQRIKTEGTCYEAYARDKDGRRVEVFLDPMTLQVVRVKDKS